jgi:hypothetical protein
LRPGEERPSYRGGDSGVDAVVEVRDPGGISGLLAFQAKRHLRPREVDDVAARSRLPRPGFRADGFVVVAPWLSQRSRDLLIGNGLGYLDLTGNVSLTLSRPGLVVRTTGADHDPDPPQRGEVGLRGRAASRLVRLLADVAPPYSASSLAGAAGLSVPYVSRLLTVLDQEALVTRGARGLVTDVDWANLLRRRAETYRVFGSNVAHGYLADTGPREAFRKLAQAGVPYLALTGSFAATLHAPVAAPSLLALYVDDPAPTATALSLLPADQGADVLLLSPYDEVVCQRTRNVDGLTAVAPSQLALDCLTGNGRMPAEGEALLEWMGEHEDAWRTRDLDDATPRTGRGGVRRG